MTNIVFISADDMSYNSTGYSGCEFTDITPNIDKLASAGVFFENAHTTVGLCQPSRSVWLTGLYPWNNGALGFEPIYNNITSLIDVLKKNNYTNGIIGKAEHIEPYNRFKWDYRLSGYSKLLKWGRDPKTFYNFCKPFLDNTPDPFFLMINSHEPHRDFPKKTKYDSSKVKVPGFLPDLPLIREELSQYYQGVTNCDSIVGEVIRALKESKKYDDTLIIFTSDHGMAFPFVKANCYHFSSKVPLIWHFPKMLEPKKPDTFVSGVDIMPTILDLINIKTDIKMDGRSYLETLKTNKKFKDYVFTCLVKLYGGNYYETRAIHNKDLCFIKNYWSDGICEFHEDGSLDHNKSVIAIKNKNMDLYKKLRFRSPEELYDLNIDPFALKNTVNEDRKNYDIMLKKLHYYALKTNDKKTINHFNLKKFNYSNTFF